jgi:polyisoprenoid-binding protein YceI
MTMSTTHSNAADSPDIEGTRWRIDPGRSSVEFHVRNFYGLQTVKGRFERYDGTLDLDADPSIELTIDAASLNTNNAKRDEHLRSADFFDAASHPQVRFVSERAVVEGERLRVRGELHAAGKSTPLDFEGVIRPDGDELEIDVTTFADHRELGMTWNRLGMLRGPSKLIVRGRLVRDDRQPPIDSRRERNAR